MNNFFSGHDHWRNSEKLLSKEANNFNDFFFFFSGVFIKDKVTTVMNLNEIKNVKYDAKQKKKYLKLYTL